MNHRKILTQVATMKMPYGKYKGQWLSDLPTPYLTWYKQKGFPKGTMGVLLETLYEIKINGLEYLIEPLKQQRRK